MCGAYPIEWTYAALMEEKMKKEAYTAVCSANCRTGSHSVKNMNSR